MDSAKGRKAVELLRQSESFPPTDILQAVVSILELNLVVHFSMGPSITYQASNNKSRKTFHISCSGGVHFDALIPKTITSNYPEISTSNTVQAIQNWENSNQFTAQSLGLKCTRQKIRNVQENVHTLRYLILKVKLFSKGKSIKLEGDLGIYKPMFQGISINAESQFVFEAYPRQYIPVVLQSVLSHLAEELHFISTHAGSENYPCNVL